MQVQNLKHRQAKLGKIPDEWEIIKLGKITHPITKGTTPTTSGFTYVSEGVNFFRVENALSPNSAYLAGIA